VKKKVSAQVIALRRLLSLCNEHTSAAGFTIDDMARLPTLKDRGIKRNSILQAMNRFSKLKIVFSPGSNSKGQRIYRISNTEWANAYIEGDKSKPWLSLTPTPPINEFPEKDEHRDHFDIELTAEWFDILQRNGEVKNNQWTWRHRSFTISVNGSSLLGQLYIKPYWRTDIKRYFGQEFYDYIIDLDTRGLRQGDFCLPFGMKGERITLGGRPTQFSASHYSAQLDVRAKKSDKNARDGLFGVTDQANFNIRILDTMDALKEEMRELGEFLKESSGTSIEIMKAQNENMKMIAKLLANGKEKAEGATEYQRQDSNHEDYSYG